MKAFILVVLLLVTEGFLLTEGSKVFEKKCSAGWERFGKKCYIYEAITKSWTKAEEHCLSLGGNLASVHTNLTQNFLKRLAKSSTGNYARTWIGGFDATEESIWLWSDGSVFDFSLWHSNEPSNSGRREHCLEMNFGAEVLWNDAKCSNQFNFVCQKPAALQFVSPGKQ